MTYNVFGGTLNLAQFNSTQPISWLVLMNVDLVVYAVYSGGGEDGTEAAGGLRCRAVANQTQCLVSGT